MIASQFGSTEIMKMLNNNHSDLKLDIFDNMGRGVFAMAKNEYTRFIILSILNKKIGFLE